MHLTDSISREPENEYLIQGKLRKDIPQKRLEILFARTKGKRERAKHVFKAAFTSHANTAAYTLITPEANRLCIMFRCSGET